MVSQNSRSNFGPHDFDEFPKHVLKKLLVPTRNTSNAIGGSNQTLNYLAYFQKMISRNQLLRPFWKLILEKYLQVRIVKTVWYIDSLRSSIFKKVHTPTGKIIIKGFLNQSSLITILFGSRHMQGSFSELEAHPNLHSPV